MGGRVEEGYCPDLTIYNRLFDGGIWTFDRMCPNVPQNHKTSGCEINRNHLFYLEPMSRIELLTC